MSAARQSFPFVLSAWIALAATPALAANVTGTVDQNGYRLKIVKNEDGILLDIGAEAAFRNGEKVMLEKGGDDITARLTVLPPVVELSYFFRGLDDLTQCRFRLVLDAVTGDAQRRISAFSDRPGSRCPEADIRPVRARFSGDDRYARHLVIEVAPRITTAGVPETKDIWAQLSISSDLLDRKIDIIRAVNRFIERNTHGAFAFVPASELTAIVPLDFSLLAGGETKIHSQLGGPIYLVERLDPLYAAAAVGAFMLALFLLLRLSRRPKPLRELILGHGPDCDIRLRGDGEERVACLRIFPGDRKEIAVLAKGERVTVNGRVLKKRTLLRNDDELAIDGKAIVFT